jgi:hypothetical protein
VARGAMTPGHSAFFSFCVVFPLHNRHNGHTQVAAVDDNTVSLDLWTL